MPDTTFQLSSTYTTDGSVEPLVTDAVRRLTAGAPLRIDDGICLAFRLPTGVPCHACAEACPTRALSFDGRVMQLRGDCLGCGRCQAACPTGAAWLPGFTLATPAARASRSPATAAPIGIDCWKGSLPDDDGEAACRTLSVPCLFGVSDAEWLALRAHTLPRRLRVVDRGWCEGCAASRGEPLAARIEAINTWLATAGTPAEMQFARTPVSAGAPPRRIPDAVGRRMMGRRAFLAGVLRETVLPVAAPMAVDTTAVRAAIRRRHDAGKRRLQLIDAWSALARTFGGRPSRLPADFFFRVTASEACQDHGVCASHCPTGALARGHATPPGVGHDASATPDASRLVFDSAACIGCGHCQAVCPEGALQVTAKAGYQTVTTLASHAVACCPACGAERRVRAAPADAASADEADGELCDSCMKSRRLARSAFAQLFGGQAKRPPAP